MREFTVQLLMICCLDIQGFHNIGIDAYMIYDFTHSTLSILPACEAAYCFFQSLLAL